MYCFLRPCLVCFGSNLSKTDVILRANIISVGDSENGVLTFGVILYTCKNCCRAFSRGVPQAFLRAFLRCQQSVLLDRLTLDGTEGS